MKISIEKEDSQSLKSIEPLLNQLKTNTMVYEQLPVEMFGENDSLLFDRLKTQKDIFIKEVCHVFEIEKEDHFDENKVEVKNSYKELISECGLSKNDKNPEGYISLILKVENLLHESYGELLMDNSINEISRMILSNQFNEIKRDIRGIKYIQERF